MVPTDLPNDSILVPIDISVEAYSSTGRLGHALGAKAKDVAKSVIAGVEFFAETKINFKEAEMPIPMTVGEWRGVLGDTEDEEDDDDQEEEYDDGEEGEEETWGGRKKDGEEGEEETWGEGDVEDVWAEESPTKKHKIA